MKSVVMVRSALFVLLLAFVLSATPGFAQAAAQPAAQPQAPPAPAAPAPQPPAAFPQGSKIAIVSLQQIAQLSIDGKASTSKVQGLIAKKQAEGAAKTKQLQDNQSKLQQSGALMNETARAQLEKDIERLQVEQQRFEQDAQAEVMELQNQLQGEFQQKLFPILNQMVREKGLHVLFSAEDAGIIAGDPGIDLTLEAIKRFDAVSVGCSPGVRRSRASGEASRAGGASGEASRAGDANAKTVGGVINIPILLDRLCYRYPSMLVDAITEHEPGRRLVAVKNVTVNEEFFQGHFPGAPTLPGVLMLESLSQVAAILLLQREGAPPDTRIYLRGVNDAKFRRQVVPGDRLRLEISLGRRRASLARARAVAYVGDQIVAEAELLLGLVPDRTEIDPAAIVHPNAQIGAGTKIGPLAVIGANVRIGANCVVGASAVVDGWTDIGDGTEIFPLASIGLIPQDLKFKGEETRLVIGRGNIFREFVTIHRGTRGGGGVTTIGDRNVFMAYVHVAHDCHVGNDTIFGNMATLGGHVTVEDFANVSAGSGVHQFCRVGQYTFIGGYSVVTKDALPFARTVGSRPARIFGANTIGLMRRGVPQDVIEKLKGSFRYLLQSKLNTTKAMQQIRRDRSLSCKEVEYLLDFIGSSQRGVILRRPTRRAEVLADE